MLERTDYKVNIPKFDGLFQGFKTPLNEPTGNFFYDPWLIKDKYVGTVWEKLLASLPHPHGEARVIIMEPGSSYMAHSDIDNRWHLNIQGDYSYLIDLTTLQMYELKKDGYWYYMDAGKIHTASNYGSVPRVQLVVRELLTSTDSSELSQVTIKPAMPQYDYRYKFDNQISPWLNQVNKENKIKDFEYKDETVKFKIPVTELSGLKLSKDFRIEVASIP
jgi:hypothetical protein